jgi:SNF2 family DNA or RNA helicase
MFCSIVLDESHSIKSPDAGTTKAVLNLTGDMRLCVTGTPVNTAVSDLFSQFRFLGMKPLINKSNFEAAIDSNLQQRTGRHSWQYDTTLVSPSNVAR